MLKGPKTEGLKPTLSSNTKILGVSIIEGICYVNLDKSFLSDSMDVQEKLPIYSIVNSLNRRINIRRCADFGGRRNKGYISGNYGIR